MNSVRFGIVGCGSIHSTHIQAIGKIGRAEVAGVFDIDPDKTRASAEKYGTVPCGSLEQLIEFSHALIVCTPSGTHAKIGVQAARAGKHVLVEKPIDVSYAAANELVEACKQAKVKCGVISQHRFSRAIQRLRHAAQNGEFGPLIAGDMVNKWYRTQAYYDSGDWRGTWELDGGGCLMNQGIHYVDMLQWTMGGVRAVQAQMRTAAHAIEVEDHVQALLEFNNGATGVLVGSTCAYPGMAERLEIHGLYGTAIVEADKVRFWKVDPEAPTDPNPYGKGVQYHPTTKVSLSDPADSEEEDDPTAKWGEQHRLQIEDFTEALIHNRQPFVTGEMALEPLKVILAVYRSARDGGRRVEVNECATASASD